MLRAVISMTSWHVTLISDRVMVNRIAMEKGPSLTRKSETCEGIERFDPRSSQNKDVWIPASGLGMSIPRGWRRPEPLVKDGVVLPGNLLVAYKQRNLSDLGPARTWLWQRLLDLFPSRTVKQAEGQAGGNAQRQHDRT